MLKTKIKKVQFHVGAYIGNSVESGAAPGIKGVESVEFVTISEGIKGVLITSRKAGQKLTNFVPITNVTGSCVELEEVVAEKSPKKP